MFKSASTFSPSERKALLDKFRASNMSISAFARQHDVRHQTIWNWLQQAKGKNEGETSQRKIRRQPLFLPVTIQPSRPQERSTKISPIWLGAFLKELHERDLI